MGALEVLVTDILIDAGLKKLDVKSRTSIELPGYYRPEKKWDLIVVSEGQLVTAIEFKSMVGSFGKNINNRVEEAIGTPRTSGLPSGKVGSAPLLLRSWDTFSCSKTTRKFIGPTRIQRAVLRC